MLRIRHIQWQNDSLVILDQTRLPEKEVYLTLTSAEAVCEAIKMLRVRGAPAIGIAAAYGLVIEAKSLASKSDPSSFKRKLQHTANQLKRVRPTAVNLRWAIERMWNKIASMTSLEDICDALEQEAIAIHHEDEMLCRKIGENGAQLFTEENIRILTHCNAGALATGGQGTALSIIYELKKRGINVEVFADETRPLLQGARLTSWELQQAGIPVTVICDSAAATVLRNKGIEAVIVGADRIAANGDTANKIGTYSLALAARAHHIPFYVAAPYSTFDFSLKSGEEIPIEERSGEEIAIVNQKRIAPEGIAFYNPAFDITPNSLISAIITDKGTLVPPFLKNAKKLQLNT